jgi:hypothetical protein
MLFVHRYYLAVVAHRHAGKLAATGAGTMVRHVDVDGVGEMYEVWRTPVVPPRTLKYLIEIGPNYGPGMRVVWSLNRLITDAREGRTLPGTLVTEVLSLDEGEALDEASALVAAQYALTEVQKENET